MTVSKCGQYRIERLQNGRYLVWHFLSKIQESFASVDDHREYHLTPKHILVELVRALS